MLCSSVYSFFFSSRRRHTRLQGDWSSDVCSSDLRAEGEPVLTAGGAIYPYQMYYRQPWAGVTSLAQLQKIRAQGQRVWVLYTLAEYIIEAAAPDLMQALRDECAVAGVFRGTVAGGDITVCALPPASGVAA